MMSKLVKENGTIAVLTAVGLLQVIKSLKKEANKNGKMRDQNNEKMTCKCQAIRYHTLEIMK